MQRHPDRRVDAKRWLGRVIVPVVAATAVVLASAGAAYAGGDTTAQAACSTAWTTNPYGGTAEAYESFSNRFPSGSQVLVLGGRSGVRNLIDCGPSGYKLKADVITIETTFRIDGVGLSCGVGVPLGANCSISGLSVLLEYTHQCRNKAKCEHQFGQIAYSASPLAAVWQIYMQTGVRLSRNDGNAYSWTTQWV
jgi:hypothetical protein